MSRASLARRKALLLMSAALLAAGVGVAAYATDLLRRSELQSIDARFSIRGRQPTPTGVSLVAIDPATLEHVREANPKVTYPFPRRFDAAVIDRLRRAGAQAIAMDLEFVHETDIRDDNALIEAIGRAHGKTVLATVQIGQGEHRCWEANAPTRSGSRPAEVRCHRLRRGRAALRLCGRRAAQLPVVAAEVAPACRRPSLFADGALPIDYSGPPGTVRRDLLLRGLKNGSPAARFAARS